jgi:hypothetical protein
MGPDDGGGFALPKGSASFPGVAQDAGLLAVPFAMSPSCMGGFRTIAVQEYRKLGVAKVRHIIEHRLHELLAFSAAMLAGDSVDAGGSNL